MNAQQNFSLQRDTLIATPFAPFRLAALGTLPKGQARRFIEHN